MDSVSLSQSSMSIPLGSQKERAAQGPAALSNSSECENAIVAIQKEFDLYKSHIHRFCKISHKHDWDLQKALDESLKCSQKWKKKEGFTAGQIKEILERIKHDLEPIYIPKLMSTDIKEDSKQSTSNESQLTSQTTMRKLHCKRPRMKNLSDLDVVLNNRKEKVEIEEVKRSKVVKSEAPDKEYEEKILEVRKVLYQFHLYNLSHLLSVASSSSFLFQPLTHDLIVQTVKMVSEREKLSSLRNPTSVATQLSMPPPTTERDLFMLLCTEVSTIASRLLSKFDSCLAASDFAQNKCFAAFNISRTHSTGTSEVDQLGLELKWLYFDKVLQAIQKKLLTDPVSMKSAHEVELIVQSKLLHGNFDFSDDRDVVTFIGALKRYIQMVRISCIGSHKWQINEMRRSIMHEFETITAQFELNAATVHKKVVDMSKIHTRSQARVSSFKHCLDRAIAFQKYISDFQSRISIYVNHLVVDLEQAHKESFEMRARYRDISHFAEGILFQLRKKTELHKKKLCAQLADLKCNAEEALTIQEKELQNLVFAILNTKVEEECDGSWLESYAAGLPGLSINSCLVKNEAV